MIFLYSTIVLFIFTNISFLKGQTTTINISECFGVHSSMHGVELLPLDSGKAYHLSTADDFVKFRTNKRATTIHDCFYAFKTPTDMDFTFLTIFIERLEVKFSNHNNSNVTIKFVSVSNSSKSLADIVVTSDNNQIQNEYLNTYVWPKNSAIIFIRLEHNAPSNIEQTCLIRLEVTITPTYLCRMTKNYPLGSFLSFRNDKTFNLFNIKEIFNSGYIICTDSWAPFGIQYNELNSYMTFCVSYSLTCDGKINCPSNNRFPYNIRKKTYQSLHIAADENVGINSCFSPTANWILFVIIIFTIINIFLLILISYLAILRRYLPMHFLRFQASYIRCCCCCLPRRWRAYLAGNASLGHSFNRGDLISSTSSDLPCSPPTYANVRNAGERTQIRNFWRILTKRGNTNHLAESQHHLPPSYTESSDEIGVQTEQIIKNIHDQHIPSKSSHNIIINAQMKKTSGQRLQPEIQGMNHGGNNRSMFRNAPSGCCLFFVPSFPFFTFVNTRRRSVEVSPLPEQALSLEGIQTLPTYTDILSENFPGTLV